MGQQQLLLLVLGIVIVGIAILVGINAYSENSVKTNWDSLLQDALRIANDAQAWKAKPELFGGSPDAEKDDEGDFTGIDFIQLAYSPTLVGAGTSITPAGCYQNVNGVYDIFLSGTDSLIVTGTNTSNQNQVRVAVGGNLEDDVVLTGSATVKGGANEAGIATDLSMLVTCAP